ncbi:MAG TPA: YlbF family regulator [Chloroflexaceae bacterium]|nr:YlbF family regulator [Chloroflexaceae bacterium]
MSVDQSYDLELGAEVRDAARSFATALSETPVFQAFEQASATLRDDVVARCAIDAYQARAQSLRALLTLGAVSPEEQAELNRLRRGYEEEPSVVAYLAAQRELVSLMQAAADRLSAQLGLDFAAACACGCGCG